MDFPFLAAEIDVTLVVVVSAMGKLPELTTIDTFSLSAVVVDVMEVVMSITAQELTAESV